MIVISGTLIGCSISLRNSNHIKFLREYIKLIFYIKTEIKYTQKPILQILENYDDNGYLFNQINECIILVNKKNNFDLSWRQAFSNLRNKYGVPLEEENIIKNFSSQLGTSDVESQINYCDYNISILNPYLKKALEKRSKDEKLPIILGVCISLMLAVIVI